MSVALKTSPGLCCFSKGSPSRGACVPSCTWSADPFSRALAVLSQTRSPLAKWRSLPSQEQEELHHLKIGSHELAFFPLYQPARAHALKYKIDYGPLRDCLKM